MLLVGRIGGLLGMQKDKKIRREISIGGGEREDIVFASLLSEVGVIGVLVLLGDMIDMVL